MTSTSWKLWIPSEEIWNMYIDTPTFKARINPTTSRIIAPKANFYKGYIAKFHSGISRSTLNTKYFFNSGIEVEEDETRKHTGKKNTSVLEQEEGNVDSGEEEEENERKKQIDIKIKITEQFISSDSVLEQLIEQDEFKNYIYENFSSVVQLEKDIISRKFRVSHYSNKLKKLSLPEIIEKIKQKEHHSQELKFIELHYSFLWSANQAARKTQTLEESYSKIKEGVSLVTLLDSSTQGSESTPSLESLLDGIVPLYAIQQMKDLKDLSEIWKEIIKKKGLSKSFHSGTVPDNILPALTILQESLNLHKLKDLSGLKEFCKKTT